MSEFGYEQTVKYEVARDLVNSRRARVAAELGVERARSTQEASTIGRLQADMRALARTMRHLDVRNEKALDEVIAAYKPHAGYASVA